MKEGKVLKLYMTMPDLMRSGHRMECDDIECDEGGIIGDINYEKSKERVMLLTCKKSYDLVEDAELVIDVGVLLENIYTDAELYGLKKGSIIEVGDLFLEVMEACEAYGYLAALAPELPEILSGNRGLFVRPMEYGKISLGDDVKVVKEAL
jgi:MOSC domain-containing protein YiiM